MNYNKGERPSGPSYEGAFGGSVTITEPPKMVDYTELIAYAHNKPIYRTSEFNEDNPDYVKVNTPKRGDVKVWRYTTPEGERKGHSALFTGESGDRAILHVDTIGVRYSSDYIKGEYKRKEFTNITHIWPPLVKGRTSLWPSKIDCPGVN